MEEEPSTLENSDLNSNQGPAVCTEKIAPAILSGTGTWLRLSMPYFPKKSVVWRYFDLYESDGYSRADTERVVKCRLSSCKRKELRLDAQSSTKGMWEHLRNKHPDEAVRCENGCVTSTEESGNNGMLEVAASSSHPVVPNRALPDAYAPYSSMADDKKYETIHQLIGKLLESMQECQDRVHISDQYTLLSFADYARLLTKAKTTTQFVCRDAPLVLPQPGTVVIYDTKCCGELESDRLQMRERLRLDGYTFDNCDSGLLPDNLYITRYFNGNGDDLEEGRIMRYEVMTTFEDAGYVLFHYVKGTKDEVDPDGSTGAIPVFCHKPKAPRLRRVDESKRKNDGSSSQGSPAPHPPVKIKRSELDGLQAIAGCLPPSFQPLLENIKDMERDDNANQSFEENGEAAGSGADDSQIEDSSSAGGVLTSTVKQSLSTEETKSETKVEKRVMNILKKAVRDQRRSKVHYLARRTKNVNWVKVAGKLREEDSRIASVADVGEPIPAEALIGLTPKLNHEGEKNNSEGDEGVANEDDFNDAVNSDDFSNEVQSRDALENDDDS